MFAAANHWLRSQWIGGDLVSGLMLITYSLASSLNHENGYYSYQTLIPFFVGLACSFVAMYIEFQLRLVPYCLGSFSTHRQ